MAASAPGFLYHYPWENWGNLKYLWYAPLAMLGWQGARQGTPLVKNVHILMLGLVCIRYLLFQAWGTASRLPYISHKYRIQTKGIKFDQVDHEANWESMLIVGTYMIWLSAIILLPEEGIPLWDWKGIIFAFVLHVGPIEWIYYWGHRALHHHILFTRYHQHHHSSFVTQPITSSNHPLLEQVFYNVLFSLPFLVVYAVGNISIAVFFIYVLFIDFMNAWGHCNFEFIPTWVFDALPPLKYIIYSPTYHSLHHTKVHTNFSLFMPLYDYIYGTVDATTDSLYQDVRKGRMTTKTDCVYLTHVSEILSTFHLQFGFQTFAAQPYSKKWYMWLMWPIAFPLMILAWLFAKPFVGATHSIKDKLELQTWVIPRFSFQYSLCSEAAKIDGWIQECVKQAQLAGAKVIALALLNKDREFDKSFMDKKGASIAVVTGDTLAAAIVAKEVEAKHKTTEAVFITSAHSRVGSAIAAYLCEQGFKVLALLHSKVDAENLRVRISPKFQNNLVFTTIYDAGKKSMVWIVGEQIGREVQKLAPRGACFYQHGVFPLHKWRKDCSYGGVPGMRLPHHAQNLNSCEDCMPRYVVRASYAAAMIHTLEGWHHHDLDDDISIELMNETWESALKHGFTTVNQNMNAT